jgi:type II secretory pathway pseudopilin PulG
MRRNSGSRPQSPLRHSGLTLVEVLMSLMVTGIGILGVVALLPLAYVRAIQATNLTNATILRFNAESTVKLNTTNFEYIYPVWTQNTNYAAGQNVIPNPAANGNTHYFQSTAAGTSGGTTPTWVLGGNTPDGTLTWVDQGVLDHYVIDPLGAALIGNQLGNGAPAIVPAGRQSITRFGGGNAGAALSQAVAAQTVTLPDSWVEQARSAVTPGAAPTTSVTFVASNAPSLTMGAADPPWRVVLTDGTGKLSETRILTSIAGTTLNWDPAQPLPSYFTPAQARVEINEGRYNWMLTVVKSSSGVASVTVTAFFHRSLTTTDEQVFQASGADGVVTPFTVYYSGTKPFVKKGGFLFDISFGRWYRILNVTNDTGSQMFVYVNQSRSQSDVLAGEQAGAGQNFGAVFLRGVVDVYPIGTE